MDFAGETTKLEWTLQAGKEPAKWDLRDAGKT